MGFPVKSLPFDCVKAFAVTRQEGLSFSFLKENGELLAIAMSSGLSISSEALEIYSELYDKIDKLCYLYPPFFRFFLAIALDLEDLGMSGHKGTELIDYVLKHEFLTSETSDMRRMEIRNLLARRGRGSNFKIHDYEDLLKRVTGFLQQADQFIKFNRPLFYEFTHLVFYITNFGNLPIAHTQKVFESLNHIGMLAYLDYDIDLLAEVCLCYIFLKKPAPEIWLKACESGLKDIDIDFRNPDELKGAPPADDYHIYLVNSWVMSIAGKPAFDEDYKAGAPIFTHRKGKKSTLSKIFQVLHPIILDSEPQNSQRPLKTLEFLSVEDTIHLQTALSSSPNGDEFFHKLTNGHIAI